ncbi:MAG: hypothetical protein GWN79_04055, partial [Actinobacteria bacterium]|nr:hypothetical protein [Actinomycetota bacterium]NIU18304.1 hypothetical protein [Actinomycetota bacterium]NIU70785.1 hypothetical protein [Actinomycetota bacterium]
APVPYLWETRLPDPGDLDFALEADLEAMIDGETFRAGEVLAPYGIRWVISVGETPLEEVFAGQLDLVPLGTGEGAAFTGEGDPPVRAFSEDGEPWSWTGTGYAGPETSGRVVLAEAADDRWGPDGLAVGPIMSVSGSDGVATFAVDERLRNQGSLAIALVGLLLVVAFVGRRRT